MFLVELLSLNNMAYFEGLVDWWGKRRITLIIQINYHF